MDPADSAPPVLATGADALATGAAGSAPAAAELAAPSPAEVLETGRLMLELLHAGYAAEGSEQAGGDAAAAHGSGVRVSRGAIRASIELYQRGDLTMGELAAVLGVSNGWASRVVEELVAARVCERTTDPSDRRVVHVRLTTRSRKTVESSYRWRLDIVARALDGLSPDEREAVRTFLARAADALVARNPGPVRSPAPARPAPPPARP